MLKSFWTLLFCLWIGIAGADLVRPPSRGPVDIESSVYLLGLHSLVPRDGYFSADVHFSFRWYDERLGYNGPVKYFVNLEVEKKAHEIWWPYIECINTAFNIMQGANYKHNQVLVIYPNGIVEYAFDLSGFFYSELDFRRFPFDKQNLQFHISSSVWDETVCRFVVQARPGAFDSAVRRVVGELEILDVEKTVVSVSEVNTNPLSGSIAGTFGHYSQFVTSVHVQREKLYYIFEIFMPLLIIFLISATIYFDYREDFLSRIWMLLELVLVFVAMKFLINQEMPIVPYLTIIDKTYIAGYCCLLISLVLVLWRHRLTLRKDMVDAKAIDRLCRWIAPTLFVLLIILIVWLS